MDQPLLSMKNIYKSFSTVKVLKGVSLEVKKGEVHALLGENGAGKSTLMKILGGVHKADQGEIMFNGTQYKDIDPSISQKIGIGFVHQELNLLDPVSVAENIFMGRLPQNKFGVINYKKLYKDTQDVIDKLDADFTPKTIVGTLTVANKQMVEIAKAISQDSKIVIFDEPTTSLSDKDVANLFRVINMLKDKGVSSIYISHRMQEIFGGLCDRATVLRDGTYISTVEMKDVTKDDIVNMMVGRELKDLFSKEDVKVGKTFLEVKNLKSRCGKVKDVSFNAKQGEIVGFAGLVGSGRTETMRLLFGADQPKSGSISVDGKVIKIASPKDAIKNGICLLTEDRKAQGLLLQLSILENVNISKIDKQVLNHADRKKIAQDYIKSLGIKVSNMHNNVVTLSGGNQQKVVLAKWLNTDTEIFIFDEPTKGIDIGAKSEIYAIMTELAKKGKTIVIVSSEMDELLAMSDKVYVMCEGVITAELPRAEADQEKIMKFATMGGSV